MIVKPIDVKIEFLEEEIIVLRKVLYNIEVLDKALTLTSNDIYLLSTIKELLPIINHNEEG